MTGLEASSGVVRMASYAPLLANANARDWSPNLIVFDSSRRAACLPCFLPVALGAVQPAYLLARPFARTHAVIAGVLPGMIMRTLLAQKTITVLYKTLLVLFC